jgi:hypothetical protein
MGHLGADLTAPLEAVRRRWQAPVAPDPGARGKTMIDRVPASGSCIRCQRSLGLASVKRGGEWYGTVACAEGRACPLDERAPKVPESALYSRPRRFFRKRMPKELKAAR